MPTARRPVIITAMPTAFHRDGRLDLDGTEQVLRKAVGSGVDGILVLGTTGEFPALDAAERQAVTEVAIAGCAGLRCIVHVGAASSYETRLLIDRARAAGARELALLTPYYLPVTDRELLRFYEAAVEAAGDLDIYAYVFRDRTGNAVSAELMRDLAQVPHVVGAKVSGEPLARLAEYRAVVDDSFALYTGGDHDLARVGKAGVQGVVSGNAAALPRPFTALADAVGRGAGVDELARAQAAVDDVCTVIAGDMARMKAAMRLQGVNAGYPRMPIEEPDEAALAEITRVVAAYDTLA